MGQNEPPSSQVSSFLFFVTAEALLLADLLCSFRSQVRFRFMYFSEYLQPGATFLFREGRAKGIGKVTNLNCEDEPMTMTASNGGGSSNGSGSGGTSNGNGRSNSGGGGGGAVGSNAGVGKQSQAMSQQQRQTRTPSNRKKG